MLTAMPHERRRAARFALALDGGEVVHDAAVVPLLRLAEALAAVPRPAASDEFRRTLRQRLLAVGTVSTAATDHTAADGVPATAWRRRLVAAGTAFAITTGGAAATAVASTGALPGDPLYDVKRTVESVQLALATSELAKGERHLQIAATRVDEVAGLLKESGAQPTDPVVVERMRKTLSSAGTSAQLGSEYFFAAYRESNDPAVLRPLDAFLRQQAAELASLTPLLPPDLLTSSQDLMSGFQRIAAQLVALSGGRSGANLSSVAPPAAGNQAGAADSRRSAQQPGVPLPGLPAAGDQVGGAADTASGVASDVASDVTSAVPSQGLIGLDVAPGKERLPDAGAQSGSSSQNLPLPLPGVSAGVNPPVEDDGKLLGVVPGVPSLTSDAPLPGGLDGPLK
jgi:hypothetical protein